MVYPFGLLFSPLAALKGFFIPSYIMSEKEIEDLLCDYFRGFGFETFQQVYSNSNGKGNYIDVIVKKDKFIFGIELKTQAIDSGSKMARWCLQAGRYARCEWMDVGRIPVFITPAISDKFLQPDNKKNRQYRHDIDIDTHHNFNSFIGTLIGIGELRRLKNKRVLMYNNFCIASFYENGKCYLNYNAYIEILKKVKTLGDITFMD